MMDTNTNELSNTSNELMYIPQMSYRNVSVLSESEDVLCESNNGFVVGGIDFFIRIYSLSQT